MADGGQHDVHAAFTTLAAACDGVEQARAAAACSSERNAGVEFTTPLWHCFGVRADAITHCGSCKSETTTIEWHRGLSLPMPPTADPAFYDALAAFGGREDLADRDDRCSLCAAAGLRHKTTVLREPLPPMLLCQMKRWTGTAANATKTLGC